jgi:NADPH:quinone reductase-like Zn-dependent oxidoreductase
MMELIVSSSNFEIITTCSPDNFNLVKSLGADHVFDYNEPASIVEIRALTKGSLSLCIDCFSEQPGYDFCSKTLTKGATYACIGMIQSDRPDIDVKFCMGVLCFNAPWKFQEQVIPAPPEMFQGSVRFAKVAEQLLAEGKISPHPKDVRKGGLKAVLDGLQEIKEKKVRGRKLVYLVEPKAQSIEG